MPFRPTCAALLLGTALCLTGCNGGTVDRHALENDSATLDSIACEGALLAHEVAAGETTYFAREQAKELRIQASNFADALGTRKTSPRSACAQGERRAIAGGSWSGSTTIRRRRVGAERRAPADEVGGCA